MAQIPYTTVDVPLSSGASIAGTAAAMREANSAQSFAIPEPDAKPRAPKKNETLRKNLGWYQLYGNMVRGGRYVFTPPQGTIDAVSGEAVLTYLIQHEKERDEEFNARIRDSFDLGYCREILTIFTSTLFRQEVDRGPIIETFGQDHVGNIDLLGHSAREFLRVGFSLAQVYGWMACITDYPRQSEHYVSAYHESQAGDRPYSRWVTPTHLWDWVLDPLTGDFLYAEIAAGEDKYKRWYPEYWELVDADGKRLDADIHSFGRVPIDVLVCQEIEADDGHAPLGRSAISEAAKIELHVYQMCSLLERHQRLALFAFLHIGEDPATVSKSGKATAPDLHLGSSHYLWSSGDVGWVEPPNSVPEEARSHIDWCIREMRRAAGVATRSEESTEAHSGRALAWEYSSRHNAVYERAQNLEDFESRLWRTHAGIMGLDIPRDIIRYPREYAVQPVEQELGELERLTELAQQIPGAMESLLPLIRRKLARVALRDIGHLPDIDEVLESIGGMGVAEEVDEALAPVEGDMGPSPEELEVEAIKADLAVVEGLVKAKAPDEMVRALVERIAEKLGVATPAVRSAIGGAEFRWYTEVQAEINVTGQEAKDLEDGDSNG